MYVEYVPKSNAPKPINWIAVRAEYEAGGISLRQLAQKLGVSRSTLERRSSKDGWANSQGNVKAEVKAEVTAKVRADVVSKRVEETLNILAEIDKGLWECIDGMADYGFKSKEGAITGFDKLARLRLELSDEYIDERLFKRGMIAVPIAELLPTSKNSESEKSINNFSDILGETENISASFTTAD